MNSKLKQAFSKKRGGVPASFGTRFLLGLSAVVSILFFQNCGADFVPLDSSSLSSFSDFACSGDLQTDFSKSYYPFFRANCVSCHAGSTPANFAQTAVDASYTEFNKTTTDKIGQYAVNPNHGAGAGGPKNSATITSVSAKFASCKNDGGGGGSGSITARTAPLIMNATATAATKNFDLDTQLQLGSGSFGGAKIYFQVRTEVVGGIQVYYIIRPSMLTVTNGVAIKAIHIVINGNRMTMATTFHGVDKVFNPGTAGLNGQNPNGNISLGTSAVEVPGAVVATDTVQFEFETLKVQ